MTEDTATVKNEKEKNGRNYIIIYIYMCIDFLPILTEI